MTVFHQGYSQCPNGQTGGQTVYDTTIATPTGITSMQLKFPKFDPHSGLVTCIRLCVTITGVVDTMSLENTSSSAQTADVFYIRNDDITGPGLLSPISNSINYHYGQYSLGPNDFVMGSGSDFISISKDTILNGVSKCVTISDTAIISQFYGTDSVTYNYNITALVSPSSSGNYNFAVGTSAFANFKFQYCTCPSSTLPINIRSFNIKKINNDKAQITWSGFDNPNATYHYEIEMSRNGRNFTSVGNQSKEEFESSAYKFLYTAQEGGGTYYFRVKQVYSNGYVRFTDIKSIELENSDKLKINIFPNPSNGVVGIKFANNYSGKFLIKISNAQGQTVFSKEEEIYGGGIRYITTLQKGMYWLKLIDVTSHLSCVNQLLIK